MVSKSWLATTRSFFEQGNEHISEPLQKKWRNSDPVHSFRQRWKSKCFSPGENLWQSVLLCQLPIHKTIPLLDLALWHWADGRLQLHAAGIASHRRKDRRRLALWHGLQSATADWLHMERSAGSEDHDPHHVAGRIRARVQSRRQCRYARTLCLYSRNKRSDHHRKT